MSATNKEASRRQWKRATLTLCVLAIFVCAFLGVASWLLPAGGSDKPQLQIDKMLPTEEEEAAAEAMKPFYVLLIGSDSRKGTALYTGKASEHAQLDQHSDVMLLVRVNPAVYKLTIVSIPRDTQLMGTTGKINDSLLNNNPEEVVSSVEKLTGVDISYYLMTDFVRFEQLIDDVGGVNVDVPIRLTVSDPSTGREIKLKAGNDQNLNGAQALVFARARQEYGDDMDVYRQANVRQIVESMIAKALQSETQTEEGVAALSETTRTNLRPELLLALALDFQAHSDEVIIYSGTGPYENGGIRKGLWIIPEDKDTWAELMDIVDNGGDPASVVEPLVYKK